MKFVLASVMLLALVTVVDARHHHSQRHHSCSNHWWVDHDLKPCKNHAKVWHGDGDPYACFGGGRYDAMRAGNVCHGWENK